MKSLLTLFLVVGCTAVFAQKQANQWIFRDYELDFNQSPVVVNRNLGDHTYNQFASISDVNGNLLFYSDGHSVWDKNNTLMANGADIVPPPGGQGGPITHNSLIIPKPGSSTIFYLFTSNPSYLLPNSGLWITTVDISLNDGLGDVTSKQIRLVKDTSYGLSAVFHDNGKDVWILTHKYNTNTYCRLLVTDTGLSAVTEQSIGPAHDLQNGQLKFSPDGRHVAVGYSYKLTSIDVFDFDDVTGEISNDRTLFFQDLDSSAAIGGLEFSSDGTKIYTALLRYEALYQFDLSGETQTAIQKSRARVGNNIFNLIYNLQLATDGKIYATKGGGGGGSAHLGVLDNPNAVAKDIVFNENALELRGGNSFIQMTPAFNQSYVFKTDFTVDGHCQSNKVNFHITNDFKLQSVLWSFGEGSTSDVREAEFTYNAPGDYTVVLKAIYADRTETITKKITVDPYTTFTLGNDRSICGGDKIMTDKKLKTYLWNTGDTTRFLTIANSGVYSVVAKNEFGCPYPASVNITKVDLPVPNLPDSALLDSNFSIELDPGQFKTYQWSTGETTRKIVNKTGGWISVRVTNDFGCEGARSVYVGVNNSDQVDPLRWELLNPMPSNKIGRDVVFIDDTRGFIITDLEVLRTTDGGKTWSVQMRMQPGVQMVFKNKIGYIIGKSGSAFKSTYNGDGWNIMSLGTSDNFTSLNVVSDNDIIITTSYSVYVSSNAGKTWTRNDIPQVNIRQAHFRTPLIGFIWSDNKVLKTTDGGKTWNTTNAPLALRAASFLNNDIGFGQVYYEPGLYKTIDGGETWTNISGGPNQQIYDMYPIDENVIVSVGEYGSIFKSVDGGVTWKATGFENLIDHNHLYSVHFLDDTRGFAVGDKGRILKTINGGKGWTEYSPTYKDFTNIQAVTRDVLYATAYSIFKSTDAGKTWVDMGSPLPTGFYYSINFVTENIGYVAIQNQVYKTTDGAKTWTNLSPFEFSYADHFNSIAFANENVGTVGGTYKTIDGGQTWKISFSPQTLSQLQFVSQDSVFGRNYNSVYRSVQAGEAWEQIAYSDDGISGMYFVNNKVGFYSTNYYLYKTIDGGKTWAKLEHAPAGSFYSINFTSEKIGFIASSYEQRYYSVDGGETWNPDEPYQIYTMASFEHIVYGAGAFGVIIRHSDANDKPMFRIGTVSITPTPTGVGIFYDLKSTISIPHAKVSIRIWNTADGFDKNQVSEEITGSVNKTLFFSRSDLKPLTTYNLEIKVIDDSNRVLDSYATTFRTPNDVTGLGDEVNGLSFYPNPITTSLTIDLPGTESFSYQVINSIGQVVSTGQSSGIFTLDTSGFARGVYFVKVRNGSRDTTFKVVKE